MPQQDRVEAIVLTPDGKLEPQSFPVPTIGDSDGLLRVELAGICRTDVDILSGEFEAPRPLIMGHEIVGRIEAIGETARMRWGVEPGDLVAVEPTAGCGSCRFCATGDGRFCPRGIGYGITTGSEKAPYLFGAYAPLMYLAPGSSVHRLPAGMSAEVGMLTTVAIANGVQWTLKKGGVQQGDHVVVQGVGPIGLSCVASARAAGAATVTAVGLQRDRYGLELAREFGADVTATADGDDIVDVVLGLTNGSCADVVIDTTGSPQALNTSIDLVRPMGTVVNAGVAGHATQARLPLDKLLRREIRLQSVYSFDSDSLRRSINLANNGNFPFEKLITHRYPLADAMSALDFVADSSANDRLKVVLIPDHGTTP